MISANFNERMPFKSSVCVPSLVQLWSQKNKIKFKTYEQHNSIELIEQSSNCIVFGHFTQIKENGSNWFKLVQIGSNNDYRFIATF